MTRVLNYKRKAIISYSAKTWWITGFNPGYQNVNQKDLQVTYKVYFNSQEMYSGFSKEKNHVVIGSLMVIKKCRD